MLGPLFCLLIGVGLVLFLILVLRFHAFLALTFSALAVAFLSNRIAATDAIPFVVAQFGDMMGSLGILLALAAIIGKCVMDSGAADRIVRFFSRLFGEKREEYSLGASGFVLSIPVFFDIVFYLLAPLARAAYARRGSDYVLLITAVGAAGAITHALVPPTPGPIIVAEAFGVSIISVFMVGLLSATVPVLAGGLFYARFINRRMPITPGDTLGVSQAELAKQAAKRDDELPGVLASFMPFILPVGLLAVSAVLTLRYEAADLPGWVTILGDRNFVFLAGALFAMGLLASRRSGAIQERFAGLETAIASGAVIAFITSAGGAFGRTLAQSGVGEVIASAAQDWNLSLMLLAFLTASLIRIAQGSATVAMVTTAGIIAPALAIVEIGYHPAYLVAMIGLGATGYSWMNDSGFWLVGKLTGLTETQTLLTWTAALTIMALTGFVWVMLLSWALPLG